MKNRSKTLMSLLLLVSLTACGSTESSLNNPSSTTAPGSSSNGDSSKTSSQTSSSDPISSGLPSSSTGPISSVIPPISSSSSSSVPDPKPAGVVPFHDLNKANGMPNLPSLGTVNMLVVPVAFQGDTTCTASGESDCATVKTNLETMFFGSGDNAGHESVKSFYSKSSYGKLQFEGEVTPVQTLPKTLKAYYEAIGTDALYNRSPDKFEANLETQLISIYSGLISSLFGSKTVYNGKDYDNDGDGDIDGIWFVYMNEYYNPTEEEAIKDNYYYAKNNLLWAFTSWNSAESVPLGTYGWASYYFSKEGGYAVPDAHTFIHETGHMLGLDDYYDYDGLTTPAGCLDMMDYNILDHDAFSKYLLGWVTPTAVEQAGTYNLKPFQENGDFLLIGADWNGTYYDQYILLEYYTPTGLNSLDASEPYTNGLQGFTENGIKAYLIDNRVGKLTYSPRTDWTWDGKFYDAFDLDSFDDNTAFAQIYSNTGSYSYDPDVAGDADYYGEEIHPLIRLLEATGSERLITPVYDDYGSSSESAAADDSSLFQEGDSFGVGITADFTFYDNIVLPFSFTVGACTSTGVTVTFTAK